MGVTSFGAELEEPLGPGELELDVLGSEEDDGLEDEDEPAALAWAAAAAAFSLSLEEDEDEEGFSEGMTNVKGDWEGAKAVCKPRSATAKMRRSTRRR